MMNGWEIAAIVLLAMGLGKDAARHGETRTDKTHIGWSLFATLVWVGILYMAGLWRGQ